MTYLEIAEQLFDAYEHDIITTNGGQPRRWSSLSIPIQDAWVAAARRSTACLPEPGDPKYDQALVLKQSLHITHLVMQLRGHDFGPELAILRAEQASLTASKDNAYRERNRCVAGLVFMAKQLGWTYGMAMHDPADEKWEADWRHIVFIDLPTGQVSWHLHDSEVWTLFPDPLPLYDPPWDGHTTEEKYRRLAALAELSDVSNCSCSLKERLSGHRTDCAEGSR